MLVVWGIFFACLMGAMINSSATVSATVLRDNQRIHPPRFTNLPSSIDLSGTAPVNRPIYTLFAVDEDLEGSIIYGLNGVFPVQTFISVNSSTGVVNLRKSLMSDTTQNTVYTARCTAYDSANPHQVAIADLNFRVLRNNFSRKAR